MRRLWSALVLVLTCTTAASAQRGMPPAEKDETRKAYTAMREVHQAYENLGTAVRVATGTSARSALATVFGGLNYLAREGGKGSFLLIGISTAGTTIPQLEAREAVPRAQWVADAFTGHDAVLANIDIFITNVDTALGVGGQVGAYTTALLAVKANLQAMKAQILGINRAFSYAQARALPFCRDVATAQGSVYDTKHGSCNVFGPHGNWILATWHIQLGWDRIIEGVLPNLLLAYTGNNGAESVAGNMDTTNGSVADMLVSFSRLADNLTIVGFNFAAIAVTPTQCGFTPLRLVMRSIERLLQFGDTTNSVTTPAEGGPIAGNPFFWAMRGTMASTLNGFNAALATRPQTHALLNAVLSDTLLAWRFSEGGFWLAFEMPSDVRNMIVGGSSGPPYDPPAGTVDFPYYFPIQRASDLRIYVRAVGGSTERTPLVQGANSVQWGTANVSISGIGNPAGGIVTITPAVPTDKHVMIERVQGTRLEELRRQPYPENDPTVGSVGPCS